MSLLHVLLHMPNNIHNLQYNGDKPLAQLDQDPLLPQVKNCLNYEDLYIVNIIHRSRVEYYALVSIDN